MARTTKRAKPKVPPVITKLLKTVNTLSVEEAVDELQLAWEEEPSLDKKRTLMKARIKLLEDAQKPKRGGKGGTSWLISKPVKVPAGSKKRATKDTDEEVLEAEEVAAARKKGGTGTVTALDLNDLGAMMGSSEGEDGTDGSSANETGAEGGEAAQSQAGAGAAGNTAAARGDAAAGANDAIAMPPPEGDPTAGGDAEAAEAKAAAEAEAAAEAAAAEAAAAEAEAAAYKEQQLDVPDYAKDEMYQQIWKEMQQEGIDKLTKVRLSEEDFDARLEQARKDADWLGFGATRMGDTDWANAANSIVFDCDSINADWQLDQRLNKGITDMTALQGADAPNLPDVEVPEGAEEAAATPDPEPEPAPAQQPEPEPEAPAAEEKPAVKPTEPVLDPMANMDALFAELGDGDAASEQAGDAPEAASEPEPAPEPVPEAEPEPESVSEADQTPEPDQTQPEPTKEAPPPAPPSAPQATDDETEGEEEIVVVFDPTPISRFSEDHQYMQIWEEMVVETLQALGLAETWKAEFDARLKRVDDSAARLLHAARQMEFDDWIHLLEDFNFDLPAIGDDAALNAAVAKIRGDLQALRGDKPEVSLPAEDTYLPPKVTANPQTVNAHKEDATADNPAADMRKPPKPTVTDTDESGQIRDDWESEDFWSWDDEDATPSTETPPPAEPTPEVTPTTVDASGAPTDNAAPVDSFDQDSGFRGVWQDIVQETLEGLRIQRGSAAPLDDRLSGAKAQADRLLHAAEQMGYAPWVETLKSFLTKTRLIGEAVMLQQTIDSLLADLELLHSGAAAVKDLLSQGATQGAAQTPPPATPAVSRTKEEARAAAQSRRGKATLDDIYKFFPKPE